MPQSQATVLLRYQEEEETDKTKQVQIEQKRTQSTKISSLFPKWGSRNAKRNENYKKKITRLDIKQIAS